MQNRSLFRKVLFQVGFYNIAILFPLEYFLLWETLNARSFLDLGCGRYSFAAILPKNIYSVGVDISDPYLRESASRKVHSKYIRSDLRTIQLKKKSFDVVMLLDVIEHLNREEALALIRKAEGYAIKKVVVFTPNGFTHQTPYDDNPYQLHRTSWMASDLMGLGYKVYGLRGLKQIHSLRRSIKSVPGRRIFRIIAQLTQVFTYFFPESAFHLFCVKRPG